MTRATVPPRPGTREHRERACLRKRRYPDHVSALAFAITQMELHQGLRLDTYPCRYCFGYHLAKASSKRRKLFARKEL